MAILSSCHDRQNTIQIDESQTQQLTDSIPSARECLTSIFTTSKDTLRADRMARKYYQDGHPWVWVTPDLQMMGDADSLAHFLSQKAREMGFDPQAFYTDLILEDINHFRHFDFDSTGVSISHTMASLEYHLTKAFLRYAAGQRYGFVNPTRLLNRSEKRPDGGYRIVYDIALQQPDDHFAVNALKEITQRHPCDYLAGLEPTQPFYRQLADRLAKDSTGADRVRILCNMERMRWRHQQTVAPEQRYVFVNIPSQQLWAVSPDSVLSMRICCGAWDTKTPLLSSQIKTVQLNPEWNIPMSIVRKDVSKHAGDADYFSRHRYFIVKRSTGDTIPASHITAEQLCSGLYRVAQQSGPRNSLGRIIFRFPNQFDVYLHDTNNREAFSAARRTLSHGCVRVQKPFELVRFLLNDADDWTLDKIRLSIDLPPETDQGRDYLAEHESSPIRLMHSAGVKPAVPVVIDYYTLYPNPETGDIESWPDRYEYDKQIARAIKPFLP